MVRSAPVRRCSQAAACLWAASAAALATLSLVLAGGAGAQDATDLRERNADLAARSRSAILELYALDSRLSAARARVKAVRGELARLENERRVARGRLRVAERAVAIADRRLGERVRQLYENGESDPVAILLGATSIEDAVTGLDGLHRFARHDQGVVAQARAARRELRRVARALEAREARVRSAAAAAEREAAALERTRDARSSYVRRLARERSLNAREIRRLEAAASAAQRRTRAVTPPAAGAHTVRPDANATLPGGGRTMNVVAVGYSLRGRTATGIPTGWGVVAVDPSVIQLRTRMSTPVYDAAIGTYTAPNFVSSPMHV